MPELSALRDMRFLGELNFGDADLITWPSGSIPGTALASGANILPSQMVLVALVPDRVPLDEFRVTGTGVHLGAAAGTPAGAMGLTYGTHGTGSPKMVGESASGNSKTNTARTVRPLPAKYADGNTVTLQVHARITVDANTSQTLDAQVFESNGEGGVGSELYTGAALVLTTSWADYDFTINPAALIAGDPLDIELTGVADDTGGASGSVIEIGDVIVLSDRRG